MENLAQSICLSYTDRHKCTDTHYRTTLTALMLVSHALSDTNGSVLRRGGAHTLLKGAIDNFSFLLSGGLEELDIVTR